MQVNADQHRMLSQQDQQDQQDQHDQHDQQGIQVSRGKRNAAQPQCVSNHKHAGEGHGSGCQHGR